MTTKRYVIKFENYFYRIQDTKTNEFIGEAFAGYRYANDVRLWLEKSNINIQNN